VGKVVSFLVPIRSRRALIATGAKQMGAAWGDAPDFSLVETPVPTAGLNAMVFIGPGRFTWQTPVNAGLVTVAVKMLKRAGYGSEQLPYLELASEGQRVQSTMADTTGSYVTVSTSLTIREDGSVMCVSVVRPWPTYGSNFGNIFLSSSDERRRVSDGNLYVSNFVVS